MSSQWQNAGPADPDADHRKTYTPGSYGPSASRAISPRERNSAKSQLYAPKELTAYLRGMAFCQARTKIEMQRLTRLARSYVKERDCSMYSESDIYHHIARAVAAAMVPTSVEEEIGEFLASDKSKRTIERANLLAEGQTETHYSLRLPNLSKLVHGQLASKKVAVPKSFKLFGKRVKIPGFTKTVQFAKAE
jgi:hypothetical protein